MAQTQVNHIEHLCGRCYLVRLRGVTQLKELNVPTPEVYAALEQLRLALIPSDAPVSAAAKSAMTGDTVAGQEADVSPLDEPQEKEALSYVDTYVNDILVGDEGDVLIALQEESRPVVAEVIYKLTRRSPMRAMAFIRVFRAFVGGAEAKRSALAE